MRTLLLTATCLLVAAPALAQVPDQPAPPADVPTLAPGWQVRLDRAEDNVAELVFINEGESFRARTGPAGIVWNPEHDLGDEFTVTATFEATDQPAGEAYGIVFAGDDLDQDDLEYAYFVIRGDGSYMIRHRAGTELHTIVDWTPSEALLQQNEEGTARNTLAIEAGEETVRFMINGTEVASLPASELDADGYVGLRINHNLDLQVSDFTVSRP